MYQALRPHAALRLLARHKTGLAGALLLGCSALAHAHHDGPEVGGFAAGLLHPFTGLDHLLAMLAVGIWAATLGRPKAWLLPLAFPLLMAAGAALGMAGVALPAIEPGIAASVVILGLAILTAWRAPTAVAVGAVALFGVLHGFAHGAELPADTSALQYAAGFLAATALLHLAGLAIGMVRLAPRGLLALRAAGGAIAATGLWLLAGVQGLV